jgi:hypothetical protein
VTCEKFWPLDHKQLMRVPPLRSVMRENSRSSGGAAVGAPFALRVPGLDLACHWLPPKMDD